jgi:alanine racemase
MIDFNDLLAANPEGELRGSLPSPVRLSRFCFDSRLVEPGDLFVAVRGLGGDGHDFIYDACARGARALLVESTESTESELIPTLVVPNTVAALEKYGAFVVKAWKPRIIAVTGTVGKTATKELVAEVLSRKYSVFRTPGNYSGRYGLAIALGGLLPEHEVAVVEMATGHFGELAAMCAIAPPEIGIVTAVDAAHLLSLGDIEGVAREKSTLISSLSADGLGLLNADDTRVMRMQTLTQAPTFSFGSSEQATYRHGEVRVSVEGTAFDVETPIWAGPVRTSWLGAHAAKSVLVGFAVAERFGIEPHEVVETVSKLPFIPGRLSPLSGLRGSRILDDSYNAAPVSMISGLDTLAALSANTRIAILGDMNELGRESESYHREVGRRASEVVDLLVTLGNAGAWIADEAKRYGLRSDQVAITFTHEDAFVAVEDHLTPETTVLVKGSAPSRMERVVRRLLANPAVAPDVLVRQDLGRRDTVVVKPDRPTWLEIDLGAIAHNVRTLVAKADGSQVMVVLKADAYGHGAIQVAHTAIRNGATQCGVACVPEAQILRNAGIDAPILVLGYTPGWQAREAVGLNLTLSVFDTKTAVAYAQAAEALNLTAKVHVKVDTGMHRLGVDYREAAAFVRAIAKLPNVDVAGIFTHFAMADDRSERGLAITAGQLRRFNDVLNDLGNSGERPPIAHAANSAALLSRSDAGYDLVRPGIAVYGLPPDPSIPVPELIPSLAWKSQVAQVHQLEIGEAVGYGQLWAAEQKSSVATVPVGYADGFRRAPNTWQYVLVRGQRAPVIGRVSMDQIGINVTGIQEIRPGDEVVLIGAQGTETLPATLVAEWLGTSCYEVVSEILARVPRIS